MIRITDFDGRTYPRVDYRVQSLVRTRASTTANNSASDCTDDTDTDRSASPLMRAGVRVVVLARVLSRTCQSDRAIRAMPEYAEVIGIHAWLLFPFTPSSLYVLRRQHQTKRTQGYGPWPIYNTTGQPEK